MTAPYGAAPTGTVRGARAGFTLMELLVVVTIMILIATIATLNMQGTKRSSGFRTVSSNISTMLQMTRQRACLENKSAFVFLINTNNYVLLVTRSSIWKITTPGGSLPTNYRFFYDRTFEGACDTNTPLYNLDQPGSTATIIDDTSYPNGNATISLPTVTAEGIDTTYGTDAFRMLVSPAGSWAEGDRYARQAFSPLSLPAGFVFDHTITGGGTSSDRIVIFMPNGTADIVNGLDHVTVKESLTGKTVTFRIDANGSIH